MTPFRSICFLQGVFVRHFGERNLACPTDVTYAPDGNGIIITDALNRTMTMFSADGARLLRYVRVWVLLFPLLSDFVIRNFPVVHYSRCGRHSRDDVVIVQERDLTGGWERRAGGARVPCCVCRHAVRPRSTPRPCIRVTLRMAGPRRSIALVCTSSSGGLNKRNV